LGPTKKTTDIDIHKDSITGAGL